MPGKASKTAHFGSQQSERSVASALSTRFRDKRFGDKRLWVYGWMRARKSASVQARRTMS